MNQLFGLQHRRTDPMIIQDRPRVSSDKHPSFSVLTYYLRERSWTWKPGGP